MKLRTLISLALNDCKSKYAGSRLGIVWAFIGPVITILIYWFVYTVALKGEEIRDIPYLVWLLAGIAPWFFFAEAMTGMSACFYDYQFLVKKLCFKGECLPVIRLLSALFIHIVFLGIAYILISIKGIVPNINQLWIVLWIAGGFFLCLGLGKIIAFISVRLRDIIYVINVVIQLGFWITPVFWNVEALPQILNSICRYNPVAILIEGYRSSLLFGKGVTATEFLAFFGSVIVLNALGSFLSKKIMPTIADYI